MVEKKKIIKKKKELKTKKKVIKKTVKKVVKKVPAKKVKRQYYEAIGRRKTSTARVRLFTCKPFEDEKGKITVNDKDYTDFFTTFDLREIVLGPLKRMKSINRFEATIKVNGGGIKGQAEAIRHGLSRAFVKFNPDFLKKLKRAGFLTRDSRKKERKKPGLKKARKASQWKKR
ncbi:MAG: 30S ribosomal protein S9 [Candidatus Portnoybacteria bacterium]|nr:30S ribosomal protein S9 [Candidatus Portnoybacteria bacterium]